MNRRELIVTLGGAAAWPVVAQAQSMPTVGFLISASQAGYASVMGPILKGLAEAGYIDGKNVRIEYRWADYHYDRLPALAADLVSHRVTAIFCTGSVVSAVAAKAATSTIPIVFANGSDPVKYGLVASLNKPGGNITGVTFYNSGLGPKRIELVRQLVPTAATVALLVNPKNPNAQPDSAEINEAGRNVGVRIEVINASSEAELDDVFTKIGQMRPDDLMVHIDALFNAQLKKIVGLAERSGVPTMYANHHAPSLGGLMSYVTNVDDMDRQAGGYIGKVLSGTKPSELPVLQPTKYDLIVNLKTAKKLGLVVPLIMQMTADEVIE